MVLALIYPLVHLIVAWLTARLAARKGYSGILWFFIALPLPGISALVLFCLPDVKDISSDPRARKLGHWLGNAFGVLVALALRAKIKKA